MTQFDPNAQPNANSPAQSAQASPTAPDNPQALAQTTVSDNNSAQILQICQQVLQIAQELQQGGQSTATAIAEVQADLQQLMQGNSSGGVPAVLS